MDRLLYAKYFIFMGIFVLLQHQNCDAYKVKDFAKTLNLFLRCAVRMDVPNELMELYKELRFPEDNVTKCLVKCGVLNMKLFDKNDGYNEHHVAEQITNYPIKQFFLRDSDIKRNYTDIELEMLQNELRKDIRLKPIIRKCNKLHRNEKDLCSWAYYGYTCTYDQIKDYVLNILKEE